MNHFTASWRNPGGFVKLHVQKQLLHAFPISFQYSRHASASVYHLCTPGLLASLGPSEMGRLGQCFTHFLQISQNSMIPSGA